MNVNDVEIVRSLMLSNHYIETSETEDVSFSSSILFIYSKCPLSEYST